MLTEVSQGRTELIFKDDKGFGMSKELSSFWVEGTAWARARAGKSLVRAEKHPMCLESGEQMGELSIQIYLVTEEGTCSKSLAYGR